MALPKPEEKQETVQAMFTAIAHKYDLNNSLLSFGLHHAWKRLAVRMTEANPGDTVLDLCTGTGDLAVLLAHRVGRAGQVVGVDLNHRMLAFGRKKIARLGLTNVTLLSGNAEAIQFCDGTFQAVTVAFGIRNVSNLETALAEMYRVLKPGGRAVCLEFSRPTLPVLREVYNFYSYTLLPKIGSIVSRDTTGVYTYLPDSIRAFPDQERLKALFEKTGFKDVTYRNFTGGIVAIHTGIRGIDKPAP